MSGDDWVRIIGAVAGGLVLILGAVGAVLVQVRTTHGLVNSRMDQLLDVTRASAQAQGRLEGPLQARINEGRWRFERQRQIDSDLERDRPGGTPPPPAQS